MVIFLCLGGCGDEEPAASSAPPAKQVVRPAQAAGLSEAVGEEVSGVQSGEISAQSNDIVDSWEQKRAEQLDLRFVGDIIFGRYRGEVFDPIVEPLTAEQLQGADALLEGKPFARMSAALAGDVVIANLETPVAEDVPLKSPSHADYRFAASREMVHMLNAAGFDVVSLANNHHNDLRELGHKHSEAILADLGVLAIGAAQDEAPAIRVETLEVEGWRIAFVAVTSKLNMGLMPAPPYIAFVETKNLRAELGGPKGPIAQARADHELVIVSLHWGEEYTDNPSPLQRKVARALIDEGADVVFGHHPHVLQGVESYHGGVIAYSMGNFLFENASPLPKLTGVLGLQFSAGKVGARACLRGGSFFPAIMQRKPFHHPAPATGVNLRKVTDRFVRLSAKLKTSWLVGEPREPFVLNQLPKCETD